MQDFLFQFRLNAPNVTSAEPVRISVKNVIFDLFFTERKILTNGKKLHAIVAAQDEKYGYRVIWPKLRDLMRRTTFFSGEQLTLGPLEIVLKAQPGQPIRDILIRDIMDPVTYRFNDQRVSALSNFVAEPADESMSRSIAYFDGAILADLLEDKFKWLYQILEALAGKEEIATKCDKCKAPVVCPNCRELKHHTSTTVKLLQQLVSEVKFDGCSAKELRRYRAKLSHFSAKSSVDAVQLERIVHQLSLAVRWYLEGKFSSLGIKGPGPSVIKSGLVSGFWTCFGAKTDDVYEKFAIRSVPTIDQLKKNYRDGKYDKD